MVHSIPTSTRHTRCSSSSSIRVAIVAGLFLFLFGGEESSVVYVVQSFSTIVSFPHSTSWMANTRTTTTLLLSTKTRDIITHSIGSLASSTASAAAASSILFSITVTETEAETEIGTEQDSDIIDRSKSLPTTETKITIEKEIVVTDDDIDDGIGVSSPPKSQESSSSKSESILYNISLARKIISASGLLAA